MNIWKVHIAMSYPFELLSNEIIGCLRVELWVRTSDFAYLVGADEDLLVLMYVPADNEQTAIRAAMAELDQALRRMDLPGITSFDAIALADNPADHSLSKGTEGIVVTFG